MRLAVVVEYNDDLEIERTTSHAPCTPNWIQKAPTERARKRKLFFLKKMSMASITDIV